MNRRNFLAGAGLAVTSSAVFNLSTAKAQSSGPNLAPYNALTASTAIAGGNALYATPGGNDWATVSNTVGNVYSDWMANGYDATFQTAIASFSPSAIAVGNVDFQQILGIMQQYQPAFTLADVQNCWTYLANVPPSFINSTLTAIQQNGLGPILLQVNQQTANLADMLGYTGVPPKGTRPGAPVQPITPSLYHKYHTGSGLLVPAVYDPQYKARLLEASYCSTSNAVMLLIGVTSLTLACMSGAGIFLLAGWGAISAGLGATGTVWGVANAIGGCRF
jgi:hypothetical protein